MGTDHKFYLIDYSRVMPPETPAKVNGERLKAAQLYRLLRPEYVKQYAIPLCSDAYSGFVPPSEQSAHAEEIEEATRMLKYDVIPTVAMHLQTLPRGGASFSVRC